ncbi:MAG: cysteine desulfurase, partial [Planctomycetes bacterium]|nr:cysteine desulfurase [Planctomycetota bacterium]
MKPIYLDYNATTPVDARVVDAMLPYLREDYGNPSSDHAYGHAARQAVATARAQVAALIGAAAEHIVFTASATEANNLALLGTARCHARPARLLISAIEHPAVTQPARHLVAQGWELHELAVDSYGILNLDATRTVLAKPAALVSVMLANNEIGTLQPLAELAECVHAAGGLLHVDAAQAAGKIAIDVNDLGADLLTLAGHKFYAPKGICALYVRPGTALQAIQFGASHERGLRPGTENVPHIVALGAAAVLAREELAVEQVRLRQLRDTLHDTLRTQIPGLRLNGHAKLRLPNTLNLSFPGISGADLLAAAPEIAASTGSACHAEAHAVSGVLAAIGCDSARA